jgi:hypothetical protein
MQEAAASIFPAWANYYTITGSSAAALTGLMFVVVTLASNRGRTSDETAEGFGTFSSPTVVHFCTALLISGVVAAPWHSLLVAGIVIALIGTYGVFYQLHITRRTKRLTIYQPMFEDWVWYAVLPLLAYAAALLSAVLLAVVPTHALFLLAAATMLLIFVGIHNAWDIVTYIAIVRAQERVDSESTPPAAR